MSDFNTENENLERAVESLDDGTTEASQTLQATADGATQNTAGLGDEFREFGRQLVRAVRAVATSDEIRHLGGEIADSLRQIGDEVQDAFERTREKDEIRAVGEQAKRVGQAIRSDGGTGAEVQGALTKALRSLNDELNKVIDQVQNRTARVGDDVEGSARDAADEADAVVSTFDDSAEQATEDVQNAWETTAHGAEDAVDKAGDSARGFWDDAPDSESQSDFQSFSDDASESHNDERG